MGIKILWEGPNNFDHNAWMIVNFIPSNSFGSCLLANFCQPLLNTGSGAGLVNVQNGVGTVFIRHTKAEAVLLSLLDSEDTGLEVRATSLTSLIIIFIANTIIIVIRISIKIITSLSSLVTITSIIITLVIFLIITIVIIIIIFITLILRDSS